MEKDLFLPDVNVADSMRDKQTIFGSFFMHDSKLKFKSNGQVYEHHVVAKSELLFSCLTCLIRYNFFVLPNDFI